MSNITKQMSAWLTEFGKKYTDRSIFTVEELDSLYLKMYGTTRTTMNREFLDKIDCSAKILEVGSNVGNQLQLLQKMGFENLYGIELQAYAVELSKTKTKGINIIQGSAFDIPFKNNYFDLVFTSGVLIHIAPADIELALKEVNRCAKKYIWGFEYFTPQYTEIDYRGQKELLWKANFSQLYISKIPNLKLIKEKYYKWLNNDNVDHMFLLEK